MEKKPRPMDYSNVHKAKFHRKRPIKVKKISQKHQFELSVNISNSNYRLSIKNNKKN